MSTSITKPRIVVIIGTTGVGKSQLAVTLAEKFNGEIINGDALQLYEGLPIATNKLPDAQRKSIPHHLLSCIRLDEETWTVGKYVRSASAIIENLIARGKFPIVVGGTHYYTQSLLFEDSLIETETSDRLSVQAQEKKWPILAASTQEMLEQLYVIDPEIASRWHPNDRRKIRHSLEVYLTSGRRPSDLYHEQHSANPGREPPQDPVNEQGSQGIETAGQSTSSLRFNALVVWINTDLDKLSARLDQRVEQMVDNGLIEEVQSMQARLQTLERSRTPVDSSKGIWTAIGFKELLPYVSGCGATGAKLNATRSEELKKQGIALTKTATRQYAKQQQKWIRGKFLRALKEMDALGKLIFLDGTELPQWPQNVEAIATDAVSAFLRGESLPGSAAPPTVDRDILTPKVKMQIRARYCETCNITVMTQQEWDAHPRSKKHRKATKPRVNWQALYPKAHVQSDDLYEKSLYDNG
ncbi:MAG: hypothetical protein Q9209_003244 [Squamulea sp. 1 TL-2023]